MVTTRSIPKRFAISAFHPEIVAVVELGIVGVIRGKTTRVDIYEEQGGCYQFCIFPVEFILVTVPTQRSRECTFVVRTNIIRLPDKNYLLT